MLGEVRSGKDVFGEVRRGRGMPEEAWGSEEAGRRGINVPLACRLQRFKIVIRHAGLKLDLQSMLACLADFVKGLKLFCLSRDKPCEIEYIVCHKKNYILPLFFLKLSFFPRKLSPCAFKVFERENLTSWKR